MNINLSDFSVSCLLKINNIPHDDNEDYSTSINKLKAAGILMKDEEYSSNVFRSVPCSACDDDDIIYDSDCDCRDVNDLQDFFVDGLYTTTGVSIPSCVYPNGTTYNGTAKIFSNYECEDKNKQFLQKTIVRETLADINTTRLTIISFNINSQSIFTTNLGTARTGKYYINGNTLITDFNEGYLQTFGKNVVTRAQYIKTPNGFTNILYYLNNGTYEVVFIVQYTLKSS